MDTTTTTTTTAINLIPTSNHTSASKNKHRITQKPANSSMVDEKRVTRSPDEMDNSKPINGRFSSQYQNALETLEAQFRHAYSCPSSKTRNLKHQLESPDVAAYVLQPDGTMAAVKWNDKSALENNTQVMAALKVEQQAQQYGRTTGLIQNTANPRNKLSHDMLNWLASGNNNSSGASSPRTHNSSVRDSLSPNQVTAPASVRSYSCSTAPRSNQHSRLNNARSKSTSAIQHTTDVKRTLSPTSPGSNNLQIIRSPGVGSSMPLTSQHNSSSQVQNSYWQPSAPSSVSKRRSPPKLPGSPTSQISTSQFVTSPKTQVNSQTVMAREKSPSNGHYTPPPVQLSKDYYHVNSQITTTREKSPNYGHYTPPPIQLPKDYYPANSRNNNNTKPVWGYFQYPERCATSDL